MPRNTISLSLLLLLFCGPLCLEANSAESDQDQQDQAVQGILYKTVINSDIESSIRQVLLRISDAKALEDRPPLSIAQLHRRAGADVREFTRAMRSFGYYFSEITYLIDKESTPATIEFKIDPGPPYMIRKVDIVGVCPEIQLSFDLPSPEELNLEPGTRIRSEAVHNARDAIVQFLQNSGYPFPVVEIGTVTIDHLEHAADIHFLLDPGPEAVFGEVNISGLSRVREEFILQRLPWNKGDVYNASLAGDLRRKLTATGLFTMVEVRHQPELEDDHNLRMLIEVTERRPRTIRAGLSYLSDTGPEVRLRWTHRNLRGKAEKLEFDFGMSDVLKRLEPSYTIPAWKRADQNLILKSGLVEENTDAYDSKSLYGEVMLERILSDELSVGLGVGYRAARIEQFGQTTDLGLFFIPTDLTWDGRDDILDPGTGMRFNVKIIPFFDTLDEKNRFVKTYASLNTYLEILPEKRIVLANRVAMGTINAESKSKVPPDERYYAGGGGSIRGYSYQTAGPMENGDPVGGLSLAEINTELRFKVTRRSGLVAFLDGGGAYETVYPDLGKKTYWGWGVGYRFYTDFGPIRADIAFPLDRRKKVDDRFQVYISLGQSF